MVLRNALQLTLGIPRPAKCSIFVVFRWSCTPSRLSSSPSCERPRPDGSNEKRRRLAASPRLTRRSTRRPTCRINSLERSRYESRSGLIFWVFTSESSHVRGRGGGRRGEGRGGRRDRRDGGRGRGKGTVEERGETQGMLVQMRSVFARMVGTGRSKPP